ncbi:MAG: 50S ribosomal protein L4 [Gemmatimonadaceae bacterium]
MAETTTQSAAAYSALGTPRDTLRLPADPFDGVVHMPAMHRAVKAYLTNQRQGNAATKTRGFVTGGNQKPWRQKGTGRARQGSIRAPNWPGGGTVFGPLPKDYEERIPRQLKALARNSALNARARESAIFVIDRFAYDAPKTSRLRNLLGRLGVDAQKVLVLTDGSKPNVYLSGRNMPNVHVMPYRDAGTYHILWSDVLLIESAALGAEMMPLAESEETLPPAATRTKPAREAPAKAAKAAAKPVAKKAAAKAPAAKKKAAAKAAAKKPAAKKSAAKKSTAAKRGKKKGG